MIERGIGHNPIQTRNFVKVALDDYFPQTLLENQNCYQKYIISGIETSAREYLPK